MEPIRSARNPRLQRVRALARTSERRAAGAFVVEGEDLVEAALRAGAQLDDLLIREGVDAPRGATGQPVDAAVLDSASTLASGTRMIAVVRNDSLPIPPSALTGVALLLCGVGDPGNVGTLLRSAAAFGAEVVVLAGCAADPTAPKAVRAAMGATFAVPTLVVDDPAAAYPTTRLIALDGAGEAELADTDLRGPVVIALGAERDGLPASVRARADQICRIPQEPAAESLNVAAAGAIALAMAYGALRASASG